MKGWVTNSSSVERSLGAGPESTFENEGGMGKLALSGLGGNPHRISFLSMVSPVSSNLPSPAPGQEQLQPMVFRTSAELLAHITKNWRTNFVTLDLNTLDELTEFMTRPFVLVVSVDAPLLTRYRRSLEWLVTPVCYPRNFLMLFQVQQGPFTGRVHRGT